MEWFLKAVKENYANFNGRARRKEYWMFSLMLCAIIIGFAILSGILGLISNILSVIILVLMIITMLALIIPAYAVSVRRMHDVGKSGWFIFVPIYSFILAITEGEKGNNQYGADPKAGE